MILSTLGHSIDLLQQRGSGGSVVRLRKDGSMLTVVPLEGQGEPIRDGRDDNLSILLNCQSMLDLRDWSLTISLVLMYGRILE